MSRKTSVTTAGDSPALQPVRGVRLAATTAGLKASGNPDLAIIELAAGSRTAALFTRNVFCAAPVHVARAHLRESESRLLLINSGCANAGTGAAGEADARATCAHAAGQFSCATEQVLPFSTGVIGQPLDVRRLCAGIDACADQLDADRWRDVATAIMTTDTHPKGASATVKLSGGPVTITGIAKGSGMIRPDMATMLAFVATDAAIEPGDLEQLLREAVDLSLHCITVDGDTSTNDAVTLSATGASGVGLTNDRDRVNFADALNRLFIQLARAIVRDAEGATRLIEIHVHGARDQAEARTVAFTVAHSPLVKTAVHGGDPNWGRILAAVGRTPVPGLEVGGIDIALGNIPLVARGQPVAGYDEAVAAGVMQGDEVPITIGLGRGESGVRIWTSDLSCDYVRINADYRT